MPINNELDAYQTYVLRLWRVPYKGKWQWRASMESPRTSERQVFAGLEQLFAYLREKCNSQVPQSRGAPDT